MKFVRYKKEEATDSYGILRKDRIVCLPELAKLSNQKLPEKLEDFVVLENKGIEKAEQIIAEITEEDAASHSILFKSTKLLAPIVTPPKIICLGLNYRDHAKEQNAVIPDEPIIFMKPHTAIIGPNESIVKPSFVNQLDYEAELAIVIGRKCRNVSISDAESCIFGYTVMNDVSARNIQFKDKQWTRGKSFDTFAPIGPCIVTSNQLQNTSNLRIRTWVNDEPRQNSTTANMVFNVQEIVHHLSRVMTLEPCDIIATGTPAGVGFTWKPFPKFLQAGDIVRIEIENIGVLENVVANEEDQMLSLN
jgi:2-keto-4-pentenoate hydratase/2-oxohepta-3-ene-1,7-dioic acid hydratase in catechol pathway